jgi:hypothetical protein
MYPTASNTWNNIIPYIWLSKRREEEWTKPNAVTILETKMDVETDQLPK